MSVELPMLKHVQSVDRRKEGVNEQVGLSKVFIAFVNKDVNAFYEYKNAANIKHTLQKKKLISLQKVIEQPI